MNQREESIAALAGRYPPGKPVGTLHGNGVVARIEVTHEGLPLVHVVLDGGEHAGRVVGYRPYELTWPKARQSHSKA